MAYTETTTRNYGQRLTGSLRGIVTGFLLFIAGTCLLWWNEGNAVKNAKAISEAESVAVNVENVKTVDPSLNGKLIHATAFADTQDTIADDLFGVKERAIKLVRKVEYFQYIEKSKSETRDKFGGGQETVTTYTYKRDWTSDPIDSEGFHDPAYQGKNFVLTTVEDKDWLADEVSFGAYVLPEFIKTSISGDNPADVHLTQELVKEYNKTIKEKIGIAPNDSNAASASYIHASGNTVYLGKSTGTPNIGDVRITYTKVDPAEISIIAKVNGKTFERYIAKNGRSFSSVTMGSSSSENMFQNAQEENSMMCWIFRLIGLLMVIGGLKSMFGILQSILMVLPFLGNIIGLGVGLICSVVGFVWSLLVIALAWLFYRPLLAIAIIAVAVGTLFYLKKRAKEKKAATATENTTSPTPQASVQPATPTETKH